MKKIFLTVLSVLFFNVFCFAQIKIFEKQEESVVQKDQSVNQVISYLKQKLTREAQEEAGTFITTNLKIENCQITKDEFKSFADSMSKITVLEASSFTKEQDDQYVKVKIKVNIDTDNVKAYLEKIMQDNKYKEQAQKAIKKTERLKKDNLELENKLKTATKQEYEQYEQVLSLQAQLLVEEQKQRELKLNKMAVEAKEEFARTEQDQNKKEMKRQKELNALKKQMEQENLKIQQKIAQEKDNIKKADLENQAKIKELENKAKEKQQSWKTNTGKISINQAIQEATKLKQETAEIINKFETLSKENEEKTLKSYNETIKFSCKTKKKDKRETDEEYIAILEKNKQITEKFEQETEENIFENKIRNIKSMLTTLKPFIEKLQYFQTTNFYDGNNSKAEFIGIEDENSDKEYFVIEVKYKKKYKLNYNFSDLGKEKVKLMHDKANQFVIEPLFSVNDKLKKELVAFNVKHLGTKTERNIGISATIKQFDEINIFNIYKQKYENQQTISKIILELSNDHKLKIFTKITDLLKNKMRSFPTAIEINDDLNELNKLSVAVSAEGMHTVGLKKDGTVVAVGDNSNGQCNVNNWKDIVAVSAGGKHTVGLKKDGTVVAVGGTIYDYGQCNVEKWEDIVAISAGERHTVGLKKDGTVVAVGNNQYGKCNDVKNWKDIVAVSAGGEHTVGLKKDGTVVAVGGTIYDYGQCNVNNWKDIVAVSAGERHTVGLKKDGTVVAVGSNEYGQCNVKNWEDIVSVSAGREHTVGLKKDGTVVAVGSNDYGQCNVKKWSINLTKKSHNKLAKFENLNHK